jgi:hypothetical protein
MQMQGPVDPAASVLPSGSPLCTHRFALPRDFPVRSQVPYLEKQLESSTVRAGFAETHTSSTWQRSPAGC